MIFLDVLRLFGTTTVIETTMAHDFRAKLDVYVNSAAKLRNNPIGPRFWPLVRKVVVRCPTQTLPSNIVLCDLPGVPSGCSQNLGHCSDYKSCLGQNSPWYVYIMCQKSVYDSSYRPSWRCICPSSTDSQDYSTLIPKPRATDMACCGLY